MIAQDPKQQKNLLSEQGGASSDTIRKDRPGIEAARMSHALAGITTNLVLTLPVQASFCLVQITSGPPLFCCGDARL